MVQLNAPSILLLTDDLKKETPKMQILKKQLKQTVILLSYSVLFSAFHPAMAESDVQMFEQALRAREMMQKHENHAAHVESTNSDSEAFRGVFYGFLPCSDCDGLKMTLSLKQNHNYLLVSQYAKASSKEIYEKGKYNWDDKTGILALTPRNKALGARQFRIEDEGTLIQLSAEGIPHGNQDSYTLRRSDTVKSRQVHIH